MSFVVEAPGSDQRPNDTLMSLFFNSLSDLIDCEVPLTASNSDAISMFVKEGGKVVEDGKSDAQYDVTVDERPVWKCYAGASRRSIIILVVPSTLNDAEKISVRKREHSVSTDEEASVKDEGLEFKPSKFEEVEVGNESVILGDLDAKEKGEDKSTHIGVVPEVRDSVDASEETGKCAPDARPYLPLFIYESKFSTISDISSKPGEGETKFVDFTSKIGLFHTEDGDIDAKMHSDDVSDNGEGSTELSAFCKTLWDKFFQMFVYGVFKNLQLGFVLSSDDVESSVEMICEESCLEIDITSFIRIICMHFRKEPVDDDVFESMLENNLIVKRPGKHSSGSTTKSTPRTPTSAVPHCGSETVHKFVQNSFLEILQTKFSRVPQNGELFYYNSNEEQVMLSILIDIQKCMK